MSWHEIGIYCVVGLIVILIVAGIASAIFEFFVFVRDGYRSWKNPRKSYKEDEWPLQTWTYLLKKGVVIEEDGPTGTQWRVVTEESWDDQNLKWLLGHQEVERIGSSHYLRPSLRFTDPVAHQQAQAIEDLRKRTINANISNIHFMVRDGTLVMTGENTARLAGRGEYDLSEHVAFFTQHGLLTLQADGTFQVDYNAPVPYGTYDEVSPSTATSHQTTTRAAYQEYLQSSGWKRRRQEALRRAGHRCQVCNSPSKLEVHHRNYQNRGNERPEDLTVLCSNCHGRFHAGGQTPVR